MDFFDSLKQNIMSAGKDFTEKTRELTDTARIKLDIKNKEDYIKQLYAEIGKHYYEDHATDASPAYTQMPLVQKALDELEKLNQELLLVKGTRECPNCHNQIEKTAKFCTFCGTKQEPLPTPEKEDIFEENEAASETVAPQDQDVVTTPPPAPNDVYTQATDTSTVDLNKTDEQ